MPRLLALVLLLLVPAPAVRAAPSADPRIEEVRAFERELRAAMKPGGDDAFLKRAWADWGDIDEAGLASLREALRLGLRGPAELECRGPRCRIKTRPRKGEELELLLRRAEDGWVVHDPLGAIGRHGVQVSMNLTVVGGPVRLLINGERTFALDDLRDGSAVTSSIDDALVPGRNRVALLPLGPTESVSLRVGSAPLDGFVDTSAADLLAVDAPLPERAEWAFEVGRPEPTPRPLSLPPEVGSLLDPPPPEAVTRAMRALGPSLRGCTEAQLVENPDTAGVVRVAFRAPEGRATDLRVVEDTTGGEILAPCVLRFLEGLPVPVDPDEVVYPFLFTSDPTAP